MVWKNPFNQKEGIAPLNYGIINNTYKIAASQAPQERKKDLYELVEDLAKMWWAKENWLLSGAVAISLLTDTYTRTHTNTDIALMRESYLLEFMVERAKEHNLFLFRRLRSYKISKNDPMKYETYRPVTAEEAINDYSKNRNLQFCRVDNYGNIIPENHIDTRIKLYFHHFKDNKLISSEGNLKISEIAPEYLLKQTIYYAKNNMPVHSVHIDYIKLIKERMVSSWRWKRNPKHQEDLCRINAFLGKPEENSQSLPIKNLNINPLPQ